MWRIILGTCIAIASIYALILWNRGVIPTSILLSVFVLSISAGVLLANKGKVLNITYDNLWTLKGAILWIAITITAISIYTISKFFMGEKVEGRYIYNVFAGFVGAYVLSFIVHETYSFVRRRF